MRLPIDRPISELIDSILECLSRGDVALPDLIARVAADHGMAERVRAVMLRLAREDRLHLREPTSEMEWALVRRLLPDGKDAVYVSLAEPQGLERAERPENLQDETNDQDREA